MTPKLDAGPVLSLATTSIGEMETAAELEPRLAELGVPCVHEAIERLEQWDGESSLGTLQDSSQASPARRLNKKDGAINWSRTAVEIFNQIRAFQPWPASYTFWQRGSGKSVRLIIHRSEVNDGQTDSNAIPGQITCRSKDRLEVQTGEGCLCLQQVQPSGKKVMEIAEFLRGYPVAEGEVFNNESDER